MWNESAFSGSRARPRAPAEERRLEQELRELCSAMGAEAIFELAEVMSAYIAAAVAIAHPCSGNEVVVACFLYGERGDYLSLDFFLVPIAEALHSFFALSSIRILPSPDKCILQALLPIAFLCLLCSPSFSPQACVALALLT